ncbi:DpnD/PcfM family protein [Methylocystis sp. ATCC 49242]|uniref:DpnD/PcfM family protein n=1 Tax=Methylocystis sp. ATCC 49242 TaxID=622637 RepID=UPI0001F87103|nr:DpnD/PcfM family protein [Methylocystis sp. ATCC 49242]
MNTYKVRLVETVRYSMTVKANTLEEAEELAKDKWADSTDPTKDFNGFGEGVEVWDSWEVTK